MIPLSQNEMEALKILWEHGELKPAQIQEKFSRSIDNGTLRSTLMNLVHKKHVARRQEGKAFIYSARVPKTTVLKNWMRSLADIFAQGSTRELVAQLTETDDLTPEDLKFLQNVAAAKASKKQK